MMIGTFAAWKTLALWVVLVLPVTVQTNSGETMEGHLDGLSETALRINQDGTIRELAFDKLLTLRPTSAQTQTGPIYRVTLVGGSKIAAQEVSLANGELIIQPRRQRSLRVPVNHVKAIRFRASAAATDAQWLGLIHQEARGDTMVIRRPGDRFDPTRGMVQGIEQGKVSFDLEGDIIAAPIEKLEGIVFGGLPAVSEDADVQVTDVYGSIWSVMNLSPSGEDQPLRMNLANSIIHELPPDQIASIRWSSGLEMLATETPVASSVKTSFATSVDDRLLEGFFGPRADGKADLLMHGGSSIEYRVPEGHQSFVGTVRRDPKITRASKMTVRIKFDGQPVWEEALPTAEPRGFELPLDQVRRLSIQVDSGGDGDLGDTVRIIRPRLLK